jgi:hypothetical protein
MPRNLRPYENEKRTKARRNHALARLDLREATTPRESSARPTSHAVKVIDKATQDAIDAFMAARRP